MTRVKVITHNGRDIIFSDFTNVISQQVILDSLDEIERIIAKRKEPYCTLYDITGSYMDAAVIQRAKALAKYVDKTKLSKGSAAIGVKSRAKRIIGTFLKRTMYFAKDMDDALAYLTADERWLE